MKHKMVYVIKDQDGRYIADRAFTKTDEGWLYSYFTGDTTGFVFYTNKLTAEKDLIKIQTINDRHGFDKRFHIEYIDFNTIRKGNRIIKSITPGRVEKMCISVSTTHRL